MILIELSIYVCVWNTKIENKLKLVYIFIVYIDF